MSTLNEKIRQLPASMPAAENVEAVIIEAQALEKEYQLLSEEQKKQCTEYDHLKELLNSNSSDLDVIHLKERNSPLKGKTIGYLGSSITVGMKSENVSFPDYIGRLTGSCTIKQAVSGGTLVYKKSDAVYDYRENISYIKQLMDPASKLYQQKHLDLLVVQLSTNDTTMDISMGSLSAPDKTADFDVSTVYGAIETIIAYAEKKWNCPVMFYINPYIHKEEYQNLEEASQKEIYQNLVVKYEKMIEALYQVQKKWGIGIIDLWQEPSFRNVDLNIKRYYMADVIHPYKAGYLFWYTPFILKKMEMYWKSTAGCHD